MADISKFVEKLREMGEDVSEEDFTKPEKTQEQIDHELLNALLGVEE